MYDTLVNYIHGFTDSPLSKEERSLVQQSFIPRKVRKRQFFLQEGEVCKYFGFVVKGAMRQYSVDDKGQEYIIRLSIENWWVGDRESYVMLTPSVYNIDAWETTDLLLITRADLLRLQEQVPAIVKMTRELDERNMIATQRRLNASISLPAERQYEEFRRCYPELVQRFPQHVIASYLGIAKETLSRVRRKTVKK